jgi:3-oxoacyl-[acyl-carrier-protein] synthase-3
MITISANGATRTPLGLGVLGTGSYLPAHVVTNEDVGEPAGVTADWITRKTGIRNRRWAKPDEATSDLATIAGRAALEQAGLGASDLSLIIVATSTPDSPQPPTACLVADELGADVGTVAFDLNVVCSGFVFAMTAAEQLVRASGGGHALVIGADTYSRILNPADRPTAILFGDGAGAVVLGPSSGRRVKASRLACFSAARDLIRVPAGGSRLPASQQTVADGLHYFMMNGRGVRDFVRDNVGPAITGFLADQGLAPADIDHFVPHQANGRMLEELAGTVDIPLERTRVTYEEYGNTGSASVPITLDHTVRSGQIQRGDLVLLAGFGGGMAMALALLRW